MSFNCGEYIKEFTEFVKSLQVKTSMEVGYGSGELIESLRLAGIKADGIDKSPALLRVSPAPYLKDISLEDYYEQQLTMSNLKRKKYGLIYSSGVLEHYGGVREMLEAVEKMASLSRKYVLTVVPNKGCAAYMTAKARTSAEWKDEFAFDESTLREIHELAGLKVCETGKMGKEWAKRFGPEESDPYLVYCLAEIV